MGVAPLRIETGRYDCLEEEQRICFNCNDTIESEAHVLLDCPLYQQIRESWFVKLGQHIPEFYAKPKQEKSLCIFSCDIIPVIRLSAKIWSDILKERRKHLCKLSVLTCTVWDLCNVFCIFILVFWCKYQGRTQRCCCWGKHWKRMSWTERRKPRGGEYEGRKP